MEFDQLSARVRHHLATGRAAEAETLLRDNTDNHRDLAEFWVLYTACLLTLDQDARAEAAARRALRLAPEHLGAGDMLASAVARQGRRDEALDIIDAVIRTWPEQASAHYRQSMILLRSVRNRDERRLARRAAEQAVRLDPEVPDYYQAAALAADVDGDNRAALDYLRAGLALDPNHQGLLRISGSIENSQKVVGERGQLLRGLLASDPTNEDLHGDFAEAFVARLGVYASGFWLFAPALAVVGALGASADGIGRYLGAGAVLLCAGLFAFWCRATFSRAARPLPAGYLKDIYQRFPLVPRAVWAYRVSWALTLLGALLGTLPDGSGFGQIAGPVLMLTGCATAQLGSAWISREIAGVPRKDSDPEERRLYLLRRSGALAGGFLPRVGLVMVQLVLFGICLSLDSRLAAVAIGSVAIGLLTVAVQLIVWQLQLGLRGNAFAYGQAVSSAANRRGLALVRGNVGAVYYIGLHLVVGFVALAGAGTTLLEGPATGGTQREQPAPPTFEEQQRQQLEQDVQELSTKFEMPELPQVPDLSPSLGLD